MKRFFKIRRIAILTCVLVIIDLVVSLTLPSFLFWLDWNYFGAALLFVLLVALNFLLIAFSIKFILKKVLDKISNEPKVVAMNVKLNIPDDVKIKNEKSLIKYSNHHHLRTLAFHKISSLDIDEARMIRKKCNKLIKSKFEKAQEKISKNKHWQYQINVFCIDEVLRFNEALDFVIKTNDTRLFEIGKMNMLYVKNTNTLIIRTFKVDYDNIFDCFKYNKMIKIFCECNDIDYKSVIKKL